MSRHEYSLWQELFTGARSGFRQQHCDVLDRPLDTSEVLETAPVDWSATMWDKAGIDIHSAWRPPRPMGGRSMQKADPVRYTKFTVGQPQTGYREAMVPLPARNDGYWIEHNPKPLWRMEFEDLMRSFRGEGAFYDRHLILIADQPDAEGVMVWELIGVSKSTGWKAAALAQYNQNGQLVGGTPITWGGTSAQQQGMAPHALSSRMWNTFDPPHRLSLSLKGSDHDPYSYPWANDWLALDPDSIDWSVLTAAERSLASAMVTHGMVVDDHGSTRITVTDGAQAASYDNLASQLTFNCLKRVTTGG